MLKNSSPQVRFQERLDKTFLRSIRDEPFSNELNTRQNSTRRGVVILQCFHPGVPLRVKAFTREEPSAGPRETVDIEDKRHEEPVHVRRTIATAGRP